MKESRIKSLFEAVRKQSVPEAPSNFSATVIGAIRRDARRTGGFSLFDELGRLFPRIAFASIVVIGLCVAADMYFTETDSTLTDNVEQVANDWMFASK